jgi:hypothetical protein
MTMVKVKTMSGVDEGRAAAVIEEHLGKGWRVLAITQGGNRYTVFLIHHNFESIAPPEEGGPYRAIATGG